MNLVWTVPVPIQCSSVILKFVRTKKMWTRTVKSSMNRDNVAQKSNVENVSRIKSLLIKQLSLEKLKNLI